MTQKSVLQTDDNFAHKIEYPHNLLRNLAKEGALTEYVLGKTNCICILNLSISEFVQIFIKILVADIGMIPSEGLRENFVNFAHVNSLFNKSGENNDAINQKVAYVLPNYEIRQEKKSPRDKKELQGKF